MDLRELELEFSVGKNYLDTTGDVYKLTTSLMQADVIFIGFPIFQASIPGALKMCLIYFQSMLFVTR